MTSRNVFLFASIFRPKNSNFKQNFETLRALHRLSINNRYSRCKKDQNKDSKPKLIRRKSSPLTTSSAGTPETSNHLDVEKG